jgi:hypothetical protein
MDIRRAYPAYEVIFQWIILINNMTQIISPKD